MTAETWVSVDVETSGPTPHTGSLLSIGAGERDEQLELVEHAAWAVICSLLLNTYEALSKP